MSLRKIVGLITRDLHAFKTEPASPSACVSKVSELSPTSLFRVHVTDGNVLRTQASLLRQQIEPKLAGAVRKQIDQSEFLSYWRTLTNEYLPVFKLLIAKNYLAQQGYSPSLESRLIAVATEEDGKPGTKGMLTRFLGPEISTCIKQVNPHLF